MKKEDRPYILLDPVGDAIVPEGYRVVDTEVAFLQHALRPERVLIRGKRLCEWAERFYHGRKIECKQVDSPLRTLQQVCAQLSEEQARCLAERLLQGGHVPQSDWSITDVLFRLYPEARWHDRLSAEHAAWWLLWLQEVSLGEAEKVLLSHQSRTWADAAEEQLKPIYGAFDASAAQALMEEWLCLSPRVHLDANLPPFPQPLPRGWIQRLRDTAKEWYITNERQALDYLAMRTLSQQAKQVVAEEGAIYYQHHPSSISTEKVQSLLPYLTPESARRIERLLPPTKPAPLDKQQDAEAVLKWVTEQYLPYRRWVLQYGDDAQYEGTEQLARGFIEWLLEFYPCALQDTDNLQRWLVFRRVRQLVDPNRLTLLVVLDGLGWQDALELHRQIGQLSDKLTSLQPQPALSALPTITLFAKPAILRGECPRFALDEQHPAADIGEVLPEGNIPVERLSHAKVGEYLIWRVNEPDKTYHERYDADTLVRDIAAELSNLAGKIVDAAHTMPPGVPKQIVVTSDHGRLFGYSRRKHPPPPGMQAKGRAAWGECRLRFDERGYLLDEESSMLYLHAERFGLTHHVAVPLDTDMFVAEGSRGGGEGFAHGGIHPEEVVVPWLMYVQDVRAPRLRCRATVSGQVGKAGRLRLEITNLEEHRVVVNALQLLMSGQEWQRLPVEQELEALSTFSTELALPMLPTKAQWKEVRALLHGRVHNIPFEAESELVEETREMYRKKDLLEELQ
jgi:hypothetical protein